MHVNAMDERSFLITVLDPVNLNESLCCHPPDNIIFAQKVEKRAIKLAIKIINLLTFSHNIYSDISRFNSEK